MTGVSFGVPTSTCRFLDVRFLTVNRFPRRKVQTGLGSLEAEGFKAHTEGRGYNFSDRLILPPSAILNAGFWVALCLNYLRSKFILPAGSLREEDPMCN